EKIEQEFKDRLGELRQQFLAQLNASRQQRDHELAEITEAWSAAVTELNQITGEMNAYCGRHAPAWEVISSPAWKPTAARSKSSSSSGSGETPESLSAIAIGHFDVGLPSSGSPGEKGTPFSLPAALEFPGRPSLLLEAEGAGRDAATEVLQNVM